MSNITDATKAFVAKTGKTEGGKGLDPKLAALQSFYGPEFLDLINAELADLFPREDDKNAPHGPFSLSERVTLNRPGAKPATSTGMLLVRSGATGKVVLAVVEPTDTARIIKFESAAAAYSQTRGNDSRDLEAKLVALVRKTQEALFS